MVTLSTRAALVLGLQPAVTISWSGIWRRLNKRDRKDAMKMVKAALRTGTSYAVECGVTNAERWRAVHGRGLYTAEGAIRGMTGLVQDITGRRDL